MRLKIHSKWLVTEVADASKLEPPQWCIYMNNEGFWRTDTRYWLPAFSTMRANNEGRNK